MTLRCALSIVASFSLLAFLRYAEDIVVPPAHARYGSTLNVYKRSSAVEAPNMSNARKCFCFFINFDNVLL